MQTHELVKDQMSITISKDLYERIRKRLAKTNFESVEQYAEYALDQVLIELENLENQDRPESVPDNSFTEKDQATVEERLRGLGYL
jgi:hypothetical protein